MVCVQEDLCLECVLFSLLSLVRMFHPRILLEAGTHILAIISSERGTCVW